MSTHFSWQAGVIGSDMEASTKLVLMVIGTYMNQHGNGAFPSYATIAKKASLSRATVIRHIDLAVDAGWLRKENRVRKSPKQGKLESDTNSYAVSYPVVAQDDQGVVSPCDQVVSQDDHPSLTGIPPLVSQCDPNTPVLTPHLTPQSKNKAQASKSPALELPDCIPADAWAMWERFRIAKGAKGWTDDAKALSIRELKKLHAAGNDPQAVIEQSIQRGWTGLFGVKQSTNQSASQRRSDWGQRLNQSLARNINPEPTDLGDFDASGRPI